MAVFIPERYKRRLTRWKYFLYILGISAIIVYIYYLQVDANKREYESSLYIPNLHVHYLNSHYWRFSSVTMYLMDDKGIVTKSIAVGMAITSKQCKWKNEDEITETFPFFSNLLPSFCKTASNGFKYNFFLAFDRNDAFYTKKINLAKMLGMFNVYVKDNCPQNSNYSMHFVWCGHSKEPARAQNDAMMAAYMNNMEYYYRINDDTKMKSSNWTELFIDKLKLFEPPFVGVVGPNHTGGLTSFLTYDFVHYTHVEIHGYYYPRFMTDWFADVWITDVYKDDHSVKLPNVHLDHTGQYGQRYVGNADPVMATKTTKAIEMGKKLIERYCKTKKTNIHQQEENIISLSLAGHNPKEIYGAIRNLHLWPIIYPKWKVRIYMLNPDSIYNNIGLIKSVRVPKHVVHKLKYLGAELVFIDDIYAGIPFPLWKYLIAGDDKCKHFLVRTNTHRFTETDALLVEDWLGKSKVQPYYCISEKLESSQLQLHHALFGAVSSKFREFINGQISQVLHSFSKQHNSLGANAEEMFFETVIWTKLNMNNSVFCYNQILPNLPLTNSSQYMPGISYSENEEILYKTQNLWQTMAKFFKKLLRLERKMNVFNSF